MFKWICLSAVVVALIFKGCAMKTVNGADEFEIVYLDMGDDPGKLVYEFNETGKATVPNRLLVDSQGRFIVLERGPNRVQCFTPEGDLEFALEITPQQLTGGEEESSAQIQYIDMFWNPDSTLGVLVRFGDLDSGTGKILVINCDQNGLYQSHFELKPPTEFIDIESALRDGLGFVWIFEDKWFVFDQYGNYNATVANFGMAVDAKGFLYTDSKPVKIVDQHGKTAATLTRDEDPKPDMISFVDAKGFVVSWTRGLEETKTPTSLANPNQLVIFRLDREQWIIEPIVTVDMQANEYRYPHAESDQAIPVQIYMKETSVIRDGTLYIMAYSSDSFWISKLDLSSDLK